MPTFEAEHRPPDVGERALEIVARLYGVASSGRA